MAVAPVGEIARFREHYRSTLLVITVGVQLTVAIGSGALLGLLGIIQWSDPMLWLITLGIFVVGSGIFITFHSVIREPLDGLLAALAHKIGEPSVLTPPNPNAKSYQKTGFRAVLQALYDAPAPGVMQDNPTENSTQSFLTKALNHTSCGIVVMGPDKRIISANSAAPIAHQQDGTPFLALDFLNDTTLQQWLAECDESAITAERRWQRISTDPQLIKKQRLFDVIASYEKGAAAETVIILVDQSARHLPEEEDLNFIAFAAHELRGPITVIRGYLDILEQELGDRMKGDEPELMQRLIVSANKLSGYINNILNVARFDRHHLQVHLFEDTISAIYATIADDMTMRAASQHRLLSVTIPDDLPTVAADRGSIGEVLANLIDNAIKYSFEGGVITVSAEQKGDYVEVSVRDNGIGMPPSVVNNLFHKFYRSHRSREAVAGTGIGLYICKAFIESHGGTITARSQENEGSTFSFTLPIYATVKDALLEDGQLNHGLIRQSGGWIKNHTMYRG